MNEDLLNELSSAMRYNPDLSIRDVITLALEFKNPTRKIDVYEGKRKLKYKPTNSDILAALRVYNNARQKDSAKYHSLASVV